MEFDYTPEWMQTTSGREALLHMAGEVLSNMSDMVEGAGILIDP